MKFRAISKNFESIQYVLKSLTSSARLASNLVFCISENSIQLFADPSYQNGPFLSCCELLKNNVFSSYLFSGISKDHNRIFFDVRCDSLLQILHSLQTNIKSLKLKLANGRDGRFVLAISVEYPSLESSRFINYNVYISIINRKYWSTFDDQQVDVYKACFQYFFFVFINK